MKKRSQSKIALNTFDCRKNMFVQDSFENRLLKGIIEGDDSFDEVLSFRLSSGDIYNVSKKIFLSLSPMLRQIVDTHHQSGDKIVVIVPDLDQVCLETVEEIFAMKWKDKSEITMSSKIVDTLKMFGYSGKIEEVEKKNLSISAVKPLQKMKQARNIQSYFMKSSNKTNNKFIHNDEVCGRTNSNEKENEEEYEQASPGELKTETTSAGNMRKTMIYKCVQCDFSTSIEDNKKSDSKLRNHAHLHIRNELKKNIRKMFKDNDCKMCGLTVNCRNQGRHLTARHEVLKREIEEIVCQMKENIQLKEEKCEWNGEVENSSVVESLMIESVIGNYQSSEDNVDDDSKVTVDDNNTIQELLLLENYNDFESSESDEDDDTEIDFDDKDDDMNGNSDDSLIKRIIGDNDTSF